MTLKDYISELDRQFKTGVAREHTYRPALQNLLASMLPHLTVSNEPARQQCGAPDYILQRKGTNIPVAFIEAKDLNDLDLGGRNKNKEQFDRYKHSLDNIIFTDYLDFWLYENGEFKDSIRIAELKGDKIVPLKENFGRFESFIRHFGDARPQKITSSSKLAEIMANKARLLADVIERTLSQGGGDGNLEGQMVAFKDVLIHDITANEFADVYAQTIAYGMFAARMHDSSPDNFSRAEARGLIPKTNPFLRELFKYIADIDLDERISWIVDDLAETFAVTDMSKVMSGFGKRTQQTDPMIHFYEDFLSAYDPKLRKSRGVWYTPQAVVNFIVRAVDGILQTEFGLPMGLADTSKTKIRVANQKSSKRSQADSYEIDIHRVQILDPATGTGTFLAETVSRIYDKFRGQAGMWQGYVEEHLLPRLNGFELLMASYTMAHLKLDLLLTETGYKAVNNERLRVFLTNSLEEHHKDTGTLFAQFLAREANGANEIKRNTPVMVVLGNPPYSGESKNKGEWIMRLMNDYKKEPDTEIPLQERNPKWINDDYCKFIRLGQYFVDKNTEGVLAYINNHSFIDNPTFRGMRWNLMRSFDKIYIIDLHGNSKKKEIAPDGGKDENVFDIQQGVSINIFVKTGRKAAGELAGVYHYDLYGRREVKYGRLLQNDLSTVPFTKLQPSAPEYFFVPKDYGAKTEYDSGFSVVDLFPVNSVGIVTTRDELLMKETPEQVEALIHDFIELEDAELREKYNIGKDSRDWSIARAKADIGKTIDKNKIAAVDHRPFDRKYLYYSGKTNGLVARPRGQVMRHFAAENFFDFSTRRKIEKQENVGLIIGRQGQVVGNMPWNLIFVTNTLIDFNLYYRGGGMAFPLHLYPSQTDFLNIGRIPNLDPKIVENIAHEVGLEFEPEKSGNEGKFAPIDLLDYIYAVLHSPSYRETYKEFLKIDFPRVPYPQGETPTERAANFRRLASLGNELRKLHLMEHPALSKLITRYPVAGNNTVEKLRWELLPEEGTDDAPTPKTATGDADNAVSSGKPRLGRVWINPTQYFDGVPLTAWNFYIGGYQPAQKWLKDRINRTLSFDDIMHYQRIIKALVMTNKIMTDLIT